MSNEDLHAEMSEWLGRVGDEFGLAAGLTEQQLGELLDIAAVAAHSVMRPAAPVTTYLVGRAMAADPALTMNDALRRIDTLAGPTV